MNTLETLGNAVLNSATEEKDEGLCLTELEPITSAAWDFWDSATCLEKLGAFALIAYDQNVRGNGNDENYQEYLQDSLTDYDAVAHQNTEPE